MSVFLLILAIWADGHSWVSHRDVDQARFGFCMPGDRNIVFSNWPEQIHSLEHSPVRPVTSREVLKTIWLPDSLGGVVGPARFVHNPLNQSVYVTNSPYYVPNIAVCDARTGKLTTVINTTVRLSSIALSETSNKLYCANADSNFLQVIDCQSNQIIGIIRLSCRAHKIVWCNAANEIYCTRPDHRRIGIIDCRGDSLVADLQVLAQPYTLYYNPISNKVYCSIVGGIVIIDAASHSIVQHIPVPGADYFFSLNIANNWVYCFQHGRNRAFIIDGVGDTLIAAMVFQPNSELFCADYNGTDTLVYLGDNVGSIIRRDAYVYVIDGNTNQVIDTLRFDARMVFSMAYDRTDNRLFLSSQPYPYDDDWFGDLFVVDCTSNTVIDTLEVGVSPAYTNGMLWEQNYNQIWVANHGSSNLPGYVVNVCAADSLVHRSKTAVGFTPYTGIINPATRKYYCIGRSDNYLLTFDLAHPEQCVMKETGEAVWDILLNSLENKIYLANSTGKTVTIINGANDSIIKQVPIGSDPDLSVLCLAFNRIDNKVYVAHSLWPQVQGYITVIDGRTNEVLDTIKVAPHPFSMLWNSIDNKLYVSSFPADTITIIDAYADTILTNIRVPNSPWSLVHNTRNDKIYCATFDSTVVIDGPTNTVVRVLGGGAYALAYNPKNNKIYRARSHGEPGFLDILDGVSDSIIKTIPTPNVAPFSLLYNSNTNTIFCVGARSTQDEVMVVDGSSDRILENFTIPAQNWGYGYIGGVAAPPRYALVFDSLNNLVYLNHYCSSKISVINGNVGVQEYTPKLPGRVVLRVYPNPAAQHATIELSLPNTREVKMAIYDVTGKIVKSINLPNIRFCRLNWQGNDYSGKKLPCGVYFLRLKAGDYSETKKLVMISK